MTVCVPCYTNALSTALCTSQFFACMIVSNICCPEYKHSFRIHNEMCFQKVSSKHDTISFDINNSTRRLILEQTYVRLADLRNSQVFVLHFDWIIRIGKSSAITKNCACCPDCKVSKCCAVDIFRSLCYWHHKHEGES